MNQFEKKSAQFDFFEVVRVISSEKAECLIGCIGLVIGKAEGDATWSYCVSFLEHEPSYMLREHELESMGHHLHREDFYDNENYVRILKKLSDKA